MEVGNVVESGASLAGEAQTEEERERFTRCEDDSEDDGEEIHWGGSPSRQCHMLVPVFNTQCGSCDHLRSYSVAAIY